MKPLQLMKLIVSIPVTLSLGGILLLVVFALKAAVSKNYNDMSIKEKEKYKTLQKSLYELVTIIPEEDK